MARLCFNELGLCAVGDFALIGGIFIGLHVSVLGTSSTSIFWLSDNISISMSKGRVDGLGRVLLLRSRSKAARHD